MSLHPELESMVGMMAAYNPNAGMPYDKDYADYLRDIQTSRNLSDKLSRPEKIVLAGCGMGVLTGVGAIVYIGGKLSRLW